MPEQVRRTSAASAVVVGSGPNGLSAAITLAQRGLKTLLIEKNSTIGGGLSSQELTLPGFIHDVCSAAHPLAIQSPFFKTLPLEKFGLKWIYSPAVLAHPHDDGTVTLLQKSVSETAAHLGADKINYEKLFSPFIEKDNDLMEDILGPVIHFPKHLCTLSKFGLKALCSAETFSRRHFKEEKTRSLFAGVAAHASAPFDSVSTTLVGLSLQIAGHSGGWPLPQGGSQSFAQSLGDYFSSLGGEIRTNTEIGSVNDLPESDLVFFDLSPRQILKIAEDKLSSGVKKSLNAYRHGPGVYKMDWALKAPIPWAAKETALAMTVHLGGTLEEIAKGEQFINEGQYSQNPFVLLCQPSLFDGSRAPEGHHTAWAYCHVPHGSTHDHSQNIENQIERFAPGFKKIILKRSIMTPIDLERRNPNLIGGDISGGLTNLKQLIFRPRMSLNPYALDGKRFWICSSSTPPGPGVHGMCGHHAAMAALTQWKKNQ